MKNLFPMVAFASLIAGCTTDTTLEALDWQQNEPQGAQIATIRSYEEALGIAQGATAMLDEDVVQTKAAARPARRLNLADGVKYMVAPQTKTGAAFTSDTLMYVFNFEDNQGFALVSANPDTEGLLAVTEQGSYDPDVVSDNEGFELFIEMAKNYIKTTVDSTTNSPGSKRAPIFDGFPMNKRVMIQYPRPLSPHVFPFVGVSNTLKENIVPMESRDVRILRPL